MYKAIVEVAYSTGAGYGHEPHQYASGKGVAFSKSPKKALRMARREADRQCGWMAAMIPIHDGWVILKGVKVIAQNREGLWFTEAI